MSATPDRRSVRSVEKAFRLLRELAAAGAPLSVPRLATACGFSKPGAYRLLRAMEKSGAVVRDAETGTYALGLLVTELASCDRQFADLRARGAGPMRWLRDACGETVLIYVALNAAEITCIEALPGLHEIRRHETAGRPIPLARGATSQVLLASRMAVLGEPTVASYLRGLPESLRPPDVAAFLTRLREVGREGCAHTVAERVAGAASIAAPIPGVTGAAVAALVLSGPIDRFTTSTLAAWKPLVMRAAREIGAQRSQTPRNGHDG